MDNYSYIANAHAAYIDELYKSYQQDPESVDFGWRKFFEGYDFSVQYAASNGNGANGQLPLPNLKKQATAPALPPNRIKKYRYVT